ncbi:unnamed protein product [Pocillopora meandrina]|uniref:Uncharacterized protein n=1 Tax=Pocillopora meandrina TaxID=46732 RepID=A0AAU9W457_9CNID|nr:unnamed protein product [Pocillopora meandrina]
MQQFKALVILFIAATVYISYSEAFHMGNNQVGQPKGDAPKDIRGYNQPRVYDEDTRLKAKRHRFEDWNTYNYRK